MLRERFNTLAGALMLAGLAAFTTVGCEGKAPGPAGRRSGAKADEGCAPGALSTYQGVQLSCEQRVKAEEFLNGATRFQIRGDGCAVLDDASCPWGPRTSDRIIAGRGAGWTLPSFAAADWVGPDKLAALQALAQAALAADVTWAFPGDGRLHAAITVAELGAAPESFVGRYVSFERVAITATRSWQTAGGDPVHAFRLRDDAGAAATVELVYFLCNPFDAGGDCDAAPAFREGDVLTLVHAQVKRYRGRLELSWENGSTEHARAGCVEGFTRGCGFDVGVCFRASETCAAGAWGACPGLAQRQASDPPNGQDDDCDGEIDENALQLTQVGELEGAVYALARLRGDTFAAVTPAGAALLDAADPAGLHLVPFADRAASRCSIADLVRDGARLALSDCAGETKLYALDPAGGAPTLMATVSADQQTHHVALAGDRLVVADWYTGLAAYELRAAGTAAPLFTRADLVHLQELRLRGDKLLALGSNALTVIDLGAGTTTVHGLPGLSSAMDVNAEGLVAIAVQGRLQLLDLEAPRPALRATTIPAKELAFADVAPGDGEAADNAARRLAVVGGDRTLRLVDVTGATPATVIAEAPLATVLAPQVLLGGDRVYLYDRSALQILAF